MVAESAAFKAAVQDSRKLTAKPTDNELLELYALYKTGTGEDFSEAVKPGTFDFKGKAKYNAWSKVATEDSLSPAAAQKKYTEVVESHKATYGYDPNKAPE